MVRGASTIGAEEANKKVDVQDREDKCNDAKHERCDKLFNILLLTRIML